MVRAPGRHPGGDPFEPGRPHHFPRGIAQLVERPLWEREVERSSRSAPTILAAGTSLLERGNNVPKAAQSSYGRRKFLFPQTLPGGVMVAQRTLTPLVRVRPPARQRGQRPQIFPNWLAGEREAIDGGLALQAFAWARAVVRNPSAIAGLLVGLTVPARLLRGDREFSDAREMRRILVCGPIVQLAERLDGIEKVGGSNPPRSTRAFRVLILLPDCNSGVFK